MARVLGFLIRYFSNYYTLHRSDLVARAASLDPRLKNFIMKGLTRMLKIKKARNTFFCGIVKSSSKLYNKSEIPFEKQQLIYTFSFKLF